MKDKTAFLVLALAISGCAGGLKTGFEGAAITSEPISCSAILDDEHIRDAQHHGSERYRELLDQYRKKKCPAPDFHNARVSAVNQRNIHRLSTQDKTLNCHGILAEKTRLDELVEWYSTEQGELSRLTIGADKPGSQIITRGQFDEMPVRQLGLGSLYEVNRCDATLSPEQKTLAKEVYRAPLRYVRKRFVQQLTEAERTQSFGVAGKDELTLSCEGLISQIRFEEDNRISHLGTHNRTIVRGGTYTATVVGALIFGEAGAALGVLLDAQSFALAGRMTKREGRLLDLLNRKSCYFEFAANPEQQEKLTALATNLTEEDRLLPCEMLRNFSLSSMARLTQGLPEDSARSRSRYNIFWTARESSALSDRDAGLIVLAEMKDCHGKDS